MKITPKLSVLLLAWTLCSCARETHSPSLDRARELHAGGRFDAAIEELRIAKTEGAAAAYEARELAVKWLIEESQAVPPRHSKRYWLNEALRWDPSSGPAQTAICSIDLEEGGYEALRNCLEKEMQGKADAPMDQIDDLKARLAKHDAVESEAAEYRRLLASTKVDDWAGLVARAPNSPEARRAMEKIQRSKSLCEDIQRFIFPALSEGRWIDKIVPRVRGEATPETRVAMLQAVTHEGSDRGKHLVDVQSDVRCHLIMPGEEALRDRLVDAYGKLAATHDHMFEQTGQMNEQTPLLVRAHDAAAANFIAVAKSITDAKEQYCKARGIDPSDPGLDDVPSGEVPAQAIAWVLPKVSQEIRTCFEAGLTKRPSLRGKIVVRFSVGLDGNVDKAEDWGSQIPDRSVLDCVQGVVKNVHFPLEPTGRAIEIWPWLMVPKAPLPSPIDASSPRTN